MSPLPETAPALVTGAAGFVGSHLVDALLARGVPVRALVRPTTDRRFLDPTRVSFALGDVGDDSSEGRSALARAAEGCGVIYHLAGVTQAARTDDFERINASGAERMAWAAAQAGVPRVVLVSSIAAAGPTPGEAALTESDPDHPVGAYGRSKLDGEVRAAGELAGSATTLVTVRPPAVYGPRDTGFVLVFQLVKFGIVPLPGGSRQELSLVHARDLAEGLILAAERGRSGARYYISGGAPVTAGEMMGAIGQALGRKPLRLDVPSVMLKVAVGFAEALSRLTGAPARLTRERLADWTAPRWTVSDARARAELGYASRIGLATGIEETAQWYRTAGWI